MFNKSLDMVDNLFCGSVTSDKQVVQQVESLKSIIPEEVSE